jgi:hypothetical protein
LFLATTLCGLAMFALVRFGPIAAARDAGVAVGAICAIRAVTAASARLGLTAVAAALVGLIPTILAANAPFSQRSLVCLECGMDRDIHQVCGRTMKDEVTQTAASRWAAPLVPAGHRHVWTGCSLYVRSRWFGHRLVGCGGPSEGAVLAWHLAREADQAAGEQAYQEYQDILNGRSPKGMTLHRQEVEAAIAAAHQAKQRP